MQSVKRWLSGVGLFATACGGGDRPLGDTNGGESETSQGDASGGDGQPSTGGGGSSTAETNATDDTGLPCVVDEVVDNLFIDSDSPLYQYHCLREVRGDLMMSVQGAPPSVFEFPKLERVGNRFSISRSNISSLDGLEKLRSVGSFSIEGNTELVDISALSGLQFMADLSIHDSPRLEDLSPIARDFSASRPRLTLSALIGLTTLDSLDGASGFQAVSLSGNTNLRDISGLATIAASAGDDFDLSLHDNPELSSLEGLEALERAGNIAFYGLPSLTTLAGLEGLRSARFLKLQGVGSVASFAPLDGLETLETLTLGGCYGDDDVLLGSPGLVSLDDFSALSELSLLTIEGHSNLASLAGFDALTHLDDLEVRRNAKLSKNAIWMLGVRLGAKMSACGNLEDIACNPCSTVDERPRGEGSLD